MKRYKTIHNIMHIFPSLKNDMFILCLFKLFLIGVTVSEPQIYKIFINKVAIEKNIKILLLVIIALLILYVLETVFLYIQTIKKNNIVYKIRTVIQKKIWTRYYNNDYDVSYTPGEIKNQLFADLDIIDSYIYEGIIEFWFQTITAIICILLLLNTNYILAFFLLLTVPITFVFTQKISKGINYKNKEYRTIYGEYENRQLQFLSNWKQIKTQNLVTLILKYFDQDWVSLNEKSFKICLLNYWSYFFIAFKDLFLLKISMYIIGAIFVLNHQMSVTEFIIFISYFEYFLNAFNKMISCNVKYSTNQYQWDIVERNISYEEDNSVKEKSEKITCISMSDIGYKYPGNRGYSLSGINIDFDNNRKIAIIGRNGSGKSTLVKVLVGDLKPGYGKILINKLDTDNYDKDFLRSRISYMSQDDMLFNISIKDNILMGNPNVTKERLDEVFERLNLKYVIESRPQKYDFEVGTNGKNFSSGERQRILLARLMVSDPDVVISDEATSAVDIDNEKIVNNVLDDFVKNRIYIVVSHRVSTLENIDEYILLKNGEIFLKGNDVISNSSLAKLMEN